MRLSGSIEGWPCRRKTTKSLVSPRAIADFLLYHLSPLARSAQMCRHLFHSALALIFHLQDFEYMSFRWIGLLVNAPLQGGSTQTNTVLQKCLLLFSVLFSFANRLSPPSVDPAQSLRKRFALPFPISPPGVVAAKAIIRETEYARCYPQSRRHPCCC
jgi:hypothetical protein